MSSPNDYIIITESQSADDSAVQSETTSQEEENAMLTLERQGVSILKKEDRPANDEPRDQFSRELMDEGGIEIVPNDDSPFL